MAISDVYSAGAHQQNIEHFANIVKLALADKNINHEEQLVLDRLAINLNITEEEYIAVLENPDAYPMNPPSSKQERLERLYNLTRMVYADNEVLGVEVNLLRKIVVGLGFPANRSSELTEKAIYLVINTYAIDEFIKKINEMTFKSDQK